MDFIKPIAIPTFVVACLFAFAAPARAAEICAPYYKSYVSDTSVSVQGGGAAVATYQSPLWAALFASSTWIWSSAFVAQPQTGETQTFILTITLPGAVSSSTLAIAADDYFSVYINNMLIDSSTADGNFLQSNMHVYNVKNFLVSGANTVKFKVTNAAYFFPEGGTVSTNPAGLLFRLGIGGSACTTVADPPSNGGGTGISGNSGGGQPYGSSLSSPGWQVVNPPVSQVILPPSGGKSAPKTTAGGEVQGTTTSLSLGDAQSARTNQLAAVGAARPLLPGWPGCLVEGLLLTLFMMLTWWFVQKRGWITAPEDREKVFRAEMLFYAALSIALMALLTWLNLFCPLVFLVIGTAVLMVVRLVYFFAASR